MISMSTTRPFLAADVGGTKTLLGLFEPTLPRPRSIEVRELATLDFPDFPSLAADFAASAARRGTTVEVACLGVAGPVIDGVATMTNVPWRVDAHSVSEALGLRRVVVLNDLQAMACALPALGAGEVHVLQPGRKVVDGTMAVVAAGTGLGESILYRTGGRFVPVPSEGGHADFAARTEREIALMLDLTRRLGRASVEDVLSGPGLTNVYRVAHHQPCTVVAPDALDDPEAPAAISAAAIERRCPGCVETLEMFVEAYGAEAGNHALRTVALGGLFVGGGIAPKILPALTDGRFMRAFLAKRPLDTLLSGIPVNVIMNADVGLLGAAVFGSQIE
jgi:glucokinase